MPKVQHTKKGLVLIDDWYPEDIHKVSTEILKLKLKDTEVKTVMYDIINTYDANNGINWDTIENSIKKLFDLNELQGA